MNKLIIFSALAIFPLSAFAQSHIAPETPPTRIEVDEANKSIHFFIDGKEQARLTADGLEVRNNVRYGGLMQDQGESKFDERTASKSEGESDAQ